MDFSPSPVMQALLPKVRSFLDEHVMPLEAGLARGFWALQPELDHVRARAKQVGLWQPQVRREAGGMGLSVLEHGMVSEVLGRTPLGHYALGCQAPDAGNLELLLEYATDDQRESFLRPLLDGTARSAFGMTEPEHAGSNPVWLSTRADDDGDAWVLHGHKWFTTAVDGAAFVIVMAVTDPDAAPHERASMIVVPTDTPGFEHVRNIPIMGEAGEGWLSHGEIRLHGARVPKANLLGPRGRGFALAQARLGPGRIHHCMRWLGVCERSFEALVHRAATRELAPGRTLGEQQTVQTWIADARAEIDAARLLVLRAAWTIDHEGLERAREQISLIKYFTADVMLRVIDRALQAHGAAGMTDEVVLSHFYRHERGARIYDGPDEVHRAVVAKRILSQARREAGQP
ncbi:MAG: acyl-CoA dehydrogenase family protein [Deltaproteobacteria bacterium]|nr:acyl-CoA dehydrogenase family protein [Deltaproteobacteria bacterium]